MTEIQIASIQKGDNVVFTHRYAYIKPGMTGTVSRAWIPKGHENQQVRVFFGYNQTGQRIQQTVPANVLEVVEDYRHWADDPKNFKCNGVH